jgi:antibiotic biosynthesis monooxygenase (ABM) superfamily enzyme
MSVVHVAVTRTVLPGCEEAFAAKLHDFVVGSVGVDGMTGIHILKPPSGSESREYGVLRSFESEEAADSFYSSKLFADWLKDIEPLVAGDPSCRRLSGLEAFFRSGGTRLPPRWKMAVVTFAGVLPTALFWSSVLTPLTTYVHWFFQAAFTNVAIVATLTWIVMPLLTRLLEHWLHPPVKPQAVSDQWDSTHPQL